MEVEKESQIIMLPTGDKTAPILQGVVYEKHIVPLNSVKNDKEWLTFGKPQHLYFTVDEEIKKGDWFLYAGYLVIQCSEGTSVIQNNKSYKKIIGSTDSKLNKGWIEDVSESDDIEYKEIITHTGVVKPSPTFIKTYCEVGGIDKVIINYLRSTDGHYDNDNVWHWKSLIPKLDSDGTFTPRLIKDSWKREELIEAFNNPYGSGNVDRDEYKFRVMQELGLN